MGECVFLLVPNLIGYFRILLIAISCYTMRSDFAVATLFYLFNVLLDNVDGFAARRLKQETRFGGMLDLLTDCCGTMCRQAHLSVLYPDYINWFQLAMTADIAGHWLYCHSSCLNGAAGHKHVTKSGNLVLRMYYTEPTLSIVCLVNELFFSMLFVLHFTEGPAIPLVSVGIFRVILVLSAPVSLAKTAISLVHLVTAAQNMAIIDVAERQARNKKGQ